MLGRMEARGVRYHHRVRRIVNAIAMPLIGVFLAMSSVLAAPHIPPSDEEVLAVVPAGARHARETAGLSGIPRLDVALPLANFYINEARSSGDLRFLGYADAVLAPWLARSPPAAQVLVLDATIMQSRHRFDASLEDLHRALTMQPTDAQAWLTQATVERVLGRYPQAVDSCEHLRTLADPLVATLCTEGVRALSGHLLEASRTIGAMSGYEALPLPVRAWRDSELGEMAERAGDDDAAERWLREGLRLAPNDFYTRAALADLLLRQQRSAETIALLSGFASFEPLLLRLALAHRLEHDGQASAERLRLLDSFLVEERRGEPVHQREQARFLLDLEGRPDAALEVAMRNWKTQREPDDALIALRAAAAAHRPQDAESVRAFLRTVGLEDRRVSAYE